MATTELTNTPPLPLPPAHVSTLPHAPGLDGLRALAVLGVLAYHLDLSWAGGGFLGVEVFFTLSGFLITQLLVVELGSTGRIDVGSFARARARRLLPALVACVVATLVIYRLLMPDASGGLRTDTLASLVYLQNWNLVLAGVPYTTALTEPSPFLHLWSLSIEGQLYMLWPLTFVGIMALRRRWYVVAVALALAVGSAVLMAVQYSPDGDDLTYYATDARASGFMIGAALAMLWQSDTWSGRLQPRIGAGLELAGGLALAALLVGFEATSEFDSKLYEHGGFLRTGLVTAAVIAAASRPRGVISWLLKRRLLVGLGKRSYGIYLYHWPIFVLLRELPWWEFARNGLALMVTFAVTELSYRYLELPIRRGGIRKVAEHLHLNRSGLALASVAGVVLVASVTALCTSGSVGAQSTNVANAAATSPSISPAAPAPSSTPATSRGSSTVVDPPSKPTVVGGAAALVIGDSIALGSADALRAALAPGSTVDGKVGRQFAAAPSIVSRWVGGHDGPIVVDLGANGTVERDDVDQVLQWSGSRRVVLVGVAVDRRWRDSNNAVLRDAASGNDSHVVFVDWAAIVGAHPGILGPDDVHPLPKGRTLLAGAVATAVSS